MNKEIHLNLKFKDGREYKDVMLYWRNGWSGEWANKENINLLVKGELEPVFDDSFFVIRSEEENDVKIDSNEFIYKFESYEIIEE